MPENNNPSPGAGGGSVRHDGCEIDNPILPHLTPEGKPYSFDGATFDPAQDGPRLSRQLAAVRTLMAYGEWRTLAEVAGAVGCSEASASARLRDLRKARFGGHMVERQRLTGGLYQYRLAVGKEEGANERGL